MNFVNIYKVSRVPVFGVQYLYCRSGIISVNARALNTRRTQNIRQHTSEQINTTFRVTSRDGDGENRHIFGVAHPFCASVEFTRRGNH